MFSNLEQEFDTLFGTTDCCGLFLSGADPAEIISINTWITYFKLIGTLNPINFANWIRDFFFKGKLSPEQFDTVINTIEFINTKINIWVDQMVSRSRTYMPYSQCKI